MVIGPAQVVPLIDVYDDLVSGATDLVGAAAAVAPAAVRQTLCAAGGLAGLLGGPLGGLQGPGSLAGNADALAGILQAACPVPPPVPAPLSPQLPPPFTGGQCPGVLYRVFGRGTGSYQGGSQTLTLSTPDLANVRGPISFGSNGSGNFRDWFVTARDAAGNVVVSNSLPTEPPAFWENRSWAILRVERVDGLPDDCGDPPSPGPTPTPPIPPLPPSPPIPTVEPDGSPGPDYVFEPVVGPIYFGPEGSINVPVTVNIGGPNVTVPISIPVSISLPDFEPTFVNPGPGPSTPGGPPTPPYTRCCDPPPPKVDPTTPAPPEGPQPDPPPGTRVIGASVVSTQTGGVGTTEYYAARPEIYVPRLATLQFRVKLGLTTRWTLPVEIKSKQQFVPAPEEGVVVGTSVEWERGWSGTYNTVLSSR